MSSTFLRIVCATIAVAATLAANPNLDADDTAATVLKLQEELRAVKEENARLKKVLAEHGIELGRGYQSIVEILDDLPAELKSAKAWDKFAESAVIKWLNTEPIGEDFEATMQISSVKIEKTASSLTNPANQWKVALFVRSQDFKYRGVTFTQMVTAGNFRGFELTGDDQFARNAEKLKIGQRITVKGKIRSVNLGKEEKSQRDVKIFLSDYDIKLPGA